MADQKGRHTLRVKTETPIGNDDIGRHFCYLTSRDRLLRANPTRQAY
ncbi:MAG: hypothetical protein INF84_10500 [Roseomonas sp.]|nr:hypothetical protein [Roseomonas sp.]